MKSLFAYLLNIIAPVLLKLNVYAETKPPNALILLGDNISSSSPGCCGSENPHTSANIDKLAKEGIRFTDLFVSEAVYVPPRADFFIGLYPHRNSCMQNRKAINAGNLSAVHCLTG